MGGGTSSGSNPSIAYPFGQSLPNTQAHRFQRQYSNPMAQGFGFSPSSQFEQRLADAGSPLANFIKQGRGFLGSYLPQSQALGQDIASRAPGAFQSFMDQANGFLQNLPGMSNEATNIQEGTRLGTENARTAMNQSFGLFDPATAHAGTLANEAERQMAQANSPIASNTLFQDALRQVMDQTNQAGAASGTLGGGGQQVMQGNATRDLAAQFANQRLGNQQSALQNLGGAYGAGQGLQLGALGAEQQGIAGYGSALQNQGQALQLQAAIRQMGPELASQLLPMLGQYGNIQQGALNLPMQALQNEQNFYTAAQNPTFGLLQATAPQVGSSSRSKGTQIL